MKVLIIIPAYNEQDNIERVVKHLTENYPEYDYVVINDGSMDKTSEICHSNHYNIIETHSDHIVNKLRFLVSKKVIKSTDIVIYYKHKSFFHYFWTKK